MCPAKEGSGVAGTHLAFLAELLRILFVQLQCQWHLNCRLVLPQKDIIVNNEPAGRGSIANNMLAVITHINHIQLDIISCFESFWLITRRCVPEALSRSCRGECHETRPGGHLALRGFEVCHHERTQRTSSHKYFRPYRNVSTPPEFYQFEYGVTQECCQKLSAHPCDVDCQHETSVFSESGDCLALQLLIEWQMSKRSQQSFQRSARVGVEKVCLG